MTTNTTNALEKTIMNAAKSAQKFHFKMTNGEYVSFSHESFLQNYIAIQLFKETHYCVNVDPSKQKIRNEMGLGGRKPLDIQKRFDIVLWKKTILAIRAVVEIKQSWTKDPVLKDIRKVSKFLNTSGGERASGYVLYYTDHRRKEWWNGRDVKFIRDRFQVVVEEIPRIVERDRSAELRAEYVSNKKAEDPWGFALFRC